MMMGRFPSHAVKGTNSRATSLGTSRWQQQAMLDDRLLAVELGKSGLGSSSQMNEVGGNQQGWFP